MGSGSWDPTTYRSTRSAKSAAGVDDFAYSATTYATPRSTWKAADRLNPLGVTVRESRDSDEHPNSVPIAIALDVTGSMASVPKLLLEKLPRVYGLVQMKGYVTDPQIMFAAIGDGFSDRVPLQVGQFESDNRADEDLTEILLEGGGGGSSQESYELFAYFMARHTVTDAWEKRKKRGYLFIIGDEKAYDNVNPMQVHNIIGDDTEPITAKAIFAEVMERFDVYYLFPQGTNYFGSPSEAEHVEHWKNLIGLQKVVLVPDTENIAEIIASIIGVAEDAVDIDDLDDDLKEIGATDEERATVGKALASIGVTSGGGSLATSDSPFGLTGDGDGGASRL